MKSSGLPLRDILIDAYDAWSELVVINLLWFGFTLLVVTAPAALAGLYYATHELSHARSGAGQNFLEGLRSGFWLGWRWTLLNLFVLAVLLANFLFYGSYRQSWSVWVQGFFLGLTVLWLLLQTFTFPLLFQMLDRRLLVALRNSLVLLMKMPWACVGLFLLLLLIAAISLPLGVPWLLFTASLSAYLANRSVLYMLDQIQPKS